jgi:butyrate kinase
MGLDYDRCNLIVAHMGGGISIGVHQQGRVVDVTNGMDEGPFTPERAGSLPTLPLLQLMWHSGADPEQMRRKLVGKGGLYAYTGTVDARKVEDEAEHNPLWLEVLQAMAYQIAKSIASMAAVVDGQVAAIVLTGGLARSALLTREIRQRVGFLGPLRIYPGEFEMEALAQGGIRVLEGKETALDYTRD